MDSCEAESFRTKLKLEIESQKTLERLKSTVEDRLEIIRKECSRAVERHDNTLQEVKQLREKGILLEHPAVDSFHFNLGCI